MSLRYRRWAGALALGILFFALGAYRIDRPGLQADEVLFAHGVFERGTVELFTKVFGWRVPLMQMPYLGGLKAIVYQPIFAVSGVSAAAVRLPMALAGAATVALTFLLLWRLAGERAAWLGGALLAVDPTFLFTVRCDWGPVAIERLLAVGGVLLFVQGRWRWGAFLFGLALWNKTTFLWTLMGLAVGLALFYRAKLMAARPLALALALACFAGGAYPWIRYNVRSRGGTARATASFDASDLAGKAGLLKRSLEGTALYGYLMRDRDARPWPRSHIAMWLLMAATIAAAAMRNRLAGFFAAAMTVAWLAMAFTKDGGASAHHTVLLWPWPQCVIAIMAARWRIFTAAVVLGVLLSAGVVARHYVLMERYGADPPWSEAVYPLTERIDAERPHGVFVTDWGMLEQILLSTRGRLPVEIAFHRHLPPGDFAGRPGWIFAGHVDTREAFPDANVQWRRVPGFQRVSIAFIRDRQGFPIFELFRFEPDAAGPDRNGPRD